MTNCTLSFFCKRLDTSTPYGSIVTDVVAYGGGWDKVIINLTDDDVGNIKLNPYSVEDIIHQATNGVKSFNAHIEVVYIEEDYKPDKKKITKKQNKKWYQSPRQRW